MARQYQAADVAACIINMALESGEYISNLQLQKLLYFCQCRSLQKTGIRLFSDNIVAWQYGPVVKDVYYAYSYRGASNILESDDTTIDNETGRLRKVARLTGEALSLVQDVFDTFKGWSAWELVRKSHRPGGAWDKVYNKDGEGLGYGDVIPDRLMRVESAL